MAKLCYDDSAFGKFVRAKYGNATSAARILGVAPVTIINNIKEPTGGYKLFGNVYQEYIETKLLLEQAQSMYAALAKRYNDLVEGKATEQDKMKEYLNK